MPARTDTRFYNVDLISDILSNGNSSRLFQSLVKKQKLFSEINAFITGDLDPGLFIVTGKLINGTLCDEGEKAILQELEKLITEVTKEELQKVKNKIEANLIFSKLSVLNKAMYLGYFQMLGDAALLDKEESKYMAVSLDNIRKTAGNLFRKEKQNTLFYKAVNNQHDE
jgi:predicted Zn-dependent peptidase